MLVNKLREDFDNKPEIKPEDKYEPEFSLEDDDSNDCYDNAGNLQNDRYLWNII